MVPEPLRRLHCKTSRESLPFPIPLYSIYARTKVTSRHRASLRFCSHLYDNEALTSKSASCVEAIHAVNTVLWHPGDYRLTYYRH